MIFLVRETEGEWTWRLHSKKLQRIIAESTDAGRSEKECLAQIDLIKLGSPEATIQYERPMPRGTDAA